MTTESLSVEAVITAAVTLLLRRRKAMRQVGKEQGCIYSDEHGEHIRLAGLPGRYPLSDESIAIGALEMLQVVGMHATVEQVVDIWRRLVEGEVDSDPALERWLDQRAEAHYLRRPA